jgi:vacuolar-type H+-ATPase subunit E/Vma4
MLTEEDFENAEAAVKAVSDAYKKNNRLSLLNDAEKTLYEFAKKVLAQSRRDFLTDKKVVISKMETVQTIPKITPMK